MKKLFFVLILFALTSCGYKVKENSGYEVKQNIEMGPSFDVNDGDLVEFGCMVLQTTIYHNGEFVVTESDIVNSQNGDSIKCARYQEAQKRIDEIEKLNKSKCND